MWWVSYALALWSFLHLAQGLQKRKEDMCSPEGPVGHPVGADNICRHIPFARAQLDGFSQTQGWEIESVGRWFVL